MGVNTDTVAHSYHPGAAMAAEAIPFPFLDSADVVVTHVAAATGVRAPLVSGTNYTIAGDGAAGAASITAAAAWPVGDVFVMVRVTDQLQKVELFAHEPLPAKALERQLDRHTMVDQEQQAIIDDVTARGLFVPVGETSLPVPSIAARANRLAVWGFAGVGAPLTAIEVTADAFERLAAIDDAIVITALNVAPINVVATDLGLGAFSTIKIVADNYVNVVRTGNAIDAVIANGTDLALGAGSKIRINANNIANININGNDLALGATSKIKINADNIGAITMVATDLALGPLASFILRAPAAAAAAQAAAAVYVGVVTTLANISARLIATQTLFVNEFSLT